MTGPPTPPPSSATEIQDATRTSVPPQAAQAAATEAAAPDAQPAPEQVQAATNASSNTNKTSYQLIFPSLLILARSGTTKELIQMAERADLNVCSNTAISYGALSLIVLSISAPARVLKSQTKHGYLLWPL